MSANYEKAQAAYKAKNGGELPSDLYLLTNAELGKILHGMTGDIKHVIRPASKEALVKRIQKLVQKSAPPASVTGTKRKQDDSASSEGAPIAKAAKVPRNCLPELSHTQVAQMRRVLALSHDQVQMLQHDKDLRPLWSSIGMKAQYPKMTGKDKVMERLKEFAKNNMVFHGHVV